MNTTPESFFNRDPEGGPEVALNSFIHRTVLIEVYTELGQDVINKLSRRELEDKIVNHMKENHKEIDASWHKPIASWVRILLRPLGQR